MGTYSPPVSRWIGSAVVPNSTNMDSYRCMFSGQRNGKREVHLCVRCVRRVEGVTEEANSLKTKSGPGRIRTYDQRIMSPLL
jgi:hypothetical protein